MKIKLTRQEVLNLWTALENLTMDGETPIKLPIKLAYPLGRTKKFIMKEVDVIREVCRFDNDFYTAQNELQRKYAEKDSKENPLLNNKGGYLIRKHNDYFRDLDKLKKEMGIYDKELENNMFLGEEMEIEVEKVHFKYLPDEMNLNDMLSIDPIVLGPEEE
jgi:hypothetical protein